MVSRLSWVVQGARAGAAFDMAELRMRFKNGRAGDFQRAAKVLRKRKQNPAWVFFPCLGDPVAWKLVVCSDAALINLWDGVSSMGAHVLFLVGQNGSCCPFVLACQQDRKSGEVHYIAAKALNLQETIDDGIYLRAILTDLLNWYVTSVPPIGRLRGQQELSGIHSFHKMVDDKRLRLDSSALKESLATDEVHMVRWWSDGVQKLFSWPIVWRERASRETNC